MKVPLFATAFYCGYTGATQAPIKLFPKLFDRGHHIGVTHESYAGRVDLVSRFRLFDYEVNQIDP